MNTDLDIQTNKKKGLKMSNNELEGITVIEPQINNKGETMSDFKHMVPIKKHTISGTYEIDSVNARDLWKALGVGKVFAAWITKRIEQYGFVQNQDYILTVSKTGNRSNVIQKDYLLTLDTAKELAMVERNEKGRQVRRYFIECEKQLKQNSIDSLKGLFEYMDVNDRTGFEFLRGVSHSSIGVNCKNILIEIPYKSKSARVYFKDLKLYDELKILKKEGMSIERFKEIQRKNEELKDKTFELNNQVLELNKRLESIGVCKGDVEKQTNSKIEQLEKTNTYLLELLDIYKKEMK